MSTSESNNDLQWMETTSRFVRAHVEFADGVRINWRYLLRQPLGQMGRSE